MSDWRRQIPSGHGAEPKKQHTGIAMPVSPAFRHPPRASATRGRIIIPFQVAPLWRGAVPLLVLSFHRRAAVVEAWVGRQTGTAVMPDFDTTCLQWSHKGQSIQGVVRRWAGNEADGMTVAQCLRELGYPRIIESSMTGPIPQSELEAIREGRRAI